MPHRSPCCSKEKSKHWPEPCVSSSFNYRPTTLTQWYSNWPVMTGIPHITQPGQRKGSMTLVLTPLSCLTCHVLWHLQSNNLCKASLWQEHCKKTLEITGVLGPNTSLLWQDGCQVQKLPSNENQPYWGKAGRPPWSLSEDLVTYWCLLAKNSLAY